LTKGCGSLDAQNKVSSLILDQQERNEMDGYLQAFLVVLHLNNFVLYSVVLDDRLLDLLL